MRENTARIDKFKHDVNVHVIPCYISNSVEEECDKKVEDTLNFLGTIVRDTVRIQLEESRGKRGISPESPITSEDVIALEELFLAFHYAARTTKTALPSPIQTIEEWIITFLGEKLEQGVSIDISQFRRDLIKRLLALTSSIEDPYNELVTFERSYAKKINVTVDVPIVNSLHRIGVHEPDSTHIAGAINHSTNTQQKTVFVTLDYSSVISKQDKIKRLLNIVCCDPLYAIYHLSS